MKNKFYSTGKIIIVGHRGAPMLAHENTLDSFMRAFNAGLKIIEIDVQLSKDEKLVIFHDWEIKNDQGLNKKICSLNYSTILEICHEKDFHIPLLNEVLDILPKKCFINIEIKSSGLFKSIIEEKILKIVKSKKIADKVIISSFNPFLIRRVKKIEPKILTALLWTNNSTPLLFNSPLWVWLCKPDGFHIDYCYANERMIKWAKKKKLTVLLFTINKTEDFIEAIRMGADGIFTDNPYII